MPSEHLVSEGSVMWRNSRCGGRESSRVVFAPMHTGRRRQWHGKIKAGHRIPCNGGLSAARRGRRRRRRRAGSRRQLRGSDFGGERWELRERRSYKPSDPRVLCRRRGQRSIPVTKRMIPSSRRLAIGSAGHAQGAEPRSDREEFVHATPPYRGEGLRRGPTVQAHKQGALAHQTTLGGQIPPVKSIGMRL